MSVHLLRSLRFGRDSRFVLIKILVPSLQTLVQARQTVIVQALLFLLCTVNTERCQVECSVVLVWFRACGRC